MALIVRAFRRTIPGKVLEVNLRLMEKASTLSSKVGCGRARVRAAQVADVA